MNKDELSRYQRKLLSLRGRLERALAASRLAHQALMKDGAQDLEDRATEESQKDMIWQLYEEKNRMYQRVLRALQRIEEATFGDCIDCGRAIDRNRLRFEPWAEYCLDCQKRWEAIEASFKKAVA